ncbi:helix-turn-helix domain-containing protein [Pedobacter hiemivivus]|uniref:Helix-turn-helix domain-containing protein n=1 Tax=Pedobacter hiemivivus TaxID=2530454 RepID=A0A4U1GDH0_9SPHI|nr:helix-turn-helix domain-containing protein [Pedobacter hiemivivus]TKC62105.1 helix-turn-helix domain-containing protein [Pedobacter hiemivivus]
MKLLLTDANSGGHLLLLNDEQHFDHFFYGRDGTNKYFTIVWNRGDQQRITIDGEQFDFPQQTILPLMFNQSFSFERSSDLTAWQFNREFYCIIDHDSEVSCVGFLFGIGTNLFINLDEASQQKLLLLLNMFVSELNTSDHMQNDMLVMLLKRLIITVTQLAKSEYIPDMRQQNERFNIIRKFNLLVEGNFHNEHSVNFYAQKLNKSPKTLSNLFALFDQKTPIQLIQERIIIEAKRLLYYTDKSAKEITYDLGFEDPAYFCNFFKKHTSFSPIGYRNKKETEKREEITISGE